MCKLAHVIRYTVYCHTGADPAIGGPGGRLPLWAALSEKTGFFRL